MVVKQCFKILIAQVRIKIDIPDKQWRSELKDPLEWLIPIHNGSIASVTYRILTLFQDRLFEAIAKKLTLLRQRYSPDVCLAFVEFSWNSTRPAAKDTRDVQTRLLFSSVEKKLTRRLRMQTRVRYKLTAKMFDVWICRAVLMWRAARRIMN